MSYIAPALQNIPKKKLEHKLRLLLQACPNCSVKNLDPLISCTGLCHQCIIKNIAYQRYYQSNIPIEYWDLEMHKHFQGPEILLKHYNYYIDHIDKIYQDGKSLCFAGTSGIGKTFTSTAILKKAVQKNYSGLYTTMSDMVAILTLAKDEIKFEARQNLMSVDFLIIDEFDPRYIQTQHQADLFGALTENIFRTRTQNTLPNIFCTNSPNPMEAFSGSVKTSIESLFARVKILPILGKDFRKVK